MANYLTSVALSAVLLAAAASGADADGRSQILDEVAHELRFYVPGVDPRELSTMQLAAIRSIIHSPRSHGDKRLEIRSVIGGPYSLRSLLFN